MKRTTLLAGLACLSLTANAESLLIENVRIFNGVDAELTFGHVLVEDGIIARVSADPIPASSAGTVIDGGNRVLSPGFIDLHAHLTMHVPSDQSDAHATVVGAIAADVARQFLDSGFTTVRDAGGTHPHLARAIDQGRRGLYLALGATNRSGQRRASSCGKSRRIEISSGNRSTPFQLSSH